MKFRLAIFGVTAAIVAMPPLSFGQKLDEPAPEKTAGTEEKKEKDWLEFYYEDPKPDEFVAQVKGFEEEGIMEHERARPVLIAFMSQVLRANRGEIKNWYEQLKGLSEAGQKTLHTAMLFSRTKEADDIMREKYGKIFEEQKVELPKILKIPLDKAETMDMLWGFYYATGSEAAIRRMIIAFRFDDAPNNPEGVKIPKGYRPFFKELPQDVTMMLLSNAERHPKMHEIMKNIYENDKTMVPVEKEWLYEVLSEIDPKAYPPNPSPTEA